MNQKLESQEYNSFNNTYNFINTELHSRNLKPNESNAIMNMELMQSKENINSSIILSTFIQVPKNSKQTKSKFSLDSLNPSPSHKSRNDIGSSLDNSDNNFLSQSNDSSNNKCNSAKESTNTDIKYKQNIINEDATRIENLIEKIKKEIKDDIIFDTFFRLDINADLILVHKHSNGQIFLGSNSYQYNYINLHMFKAVFNVIGDYPQDIFPINHNLKLTLINNKEDIDIDIQESILEIDSNHKVFFYVKPNEKLNDYNHLVDKIHNHLLKGDNILIHCQQGLVRSATLLLFYLRKYIFEDIVDANEFIGVKRKDACSPQILSQSIEKIIKKCI